MVNKWRPRSSLSVLERRSYFGKDTQESLSLCDRPVNAMNQFACLLLATLLAFSSPVRFDVERLDSVSRGPATDVVHVYYNMRDVKQPYQAIGLITVNYEKKDQWNLSGETKLIDKVIGCARGLGANGLILEVSQPQLNGPVSMRGTAIVLT